MMLAGLEYAAVSIGFKAPVTFLNLVNDYAWSFSLRSVLNRLKIDCVFDVGAHRGAFAGILRRIGYKSQIISFEPNPDDFAILSKKFSNDAKWEGYNLALGDENTRLAFNIIKSSNLSSFLEPKSVEIDRVIDVEVKRLDSLYNELPSCSPSARCFLKVDAQGYDLRVVRGAAGCIENILGLQAEISVQALYADMPHYLESLRFFESVGFELLDVFPVARSHGFGNIIEYDCLMARSACLNPATR